MSTESAAYTGAAITVDTIEALRLNVLSAIVSPLLLIYCIFRYVIITFLRSSADEKTGDKNKHEIGAMNEK